MGLEAPINQDTLFDEDKELSSKIGAKMSKSLPSRCIYIHDTPKQIKNKINSAYCPQKDVNNNPLIDIAKHIVFPQLGKLDPDRPEKFGGSISFNSFNDLIKAYSKGDVHALDLKNGISSGLSNILEKVRDYFKTQPHLLKEVINFETTR